MKAILYLSIALALGLLVVGARSLPAAAGSGSGAPPGAHRAEIEYLEMVNALRPPKDPQLLFLLMAQYSNASLQRQGVEFFAARLKEFAPRLTDVQKALYLSAIGLLRAQRAPTVSLLQRCRVRERHARASGAGQTALRWTGFRRELDCRYRSCPSSRLLP